MLRKVLVTAAATGALLVGVSAPASAAPDPTDCNTWSDLLGISWFQDCNGTNPRE